MRIMRAHSLLQLLCLTIPDGPQYFGLTRIWILICGSHFELSGKASPGGFCRTNICPTLDNLNWGSSNNGAGLQGPTACDGWLVSSRYCPPPETPSPEFYDPSPDTLEMCANAGGIWNFSNNYCDYPSGGGECDLAICNSDPNPYLDQTPERGCCYNTPILIDVAGDGFSLTDAPHGVDFDLRPDGTPERLAWPTPGSDDAWLALDRNGNATIDNGRELFGNFTPQSKTTERPNGFIALAEFDKVGQGGNRDGVIDRRDAVFANLRLWQDANHNGISEADELHTLSSLDVVSIHLDFKESKKVDQYGNQFRYRAKIDNARGAKTGRWAWDLFLVK